MIGLLDTILVKYLWFLCTVLKIASASREGLATFLLINNCKKVKCTFTCTSTVYLVGYYSAVSVAEWMILICLLLH